MGTWCTVAGVCLCTCTDRMHVRTIICQHEICINMYFVDGVSVIV